MHLCMGPAHLVRADYTAVLPLGGGAGAPILHARACAALGCWWGTSCRPDTEGLLLARGSSRGTAAGVGGSAPVFVGSAPLFSFFLGLSSSSAAAADPDPAVWPNQKTLVPQNNRTDMCMRSSLKAHVCSERGPLCSPFEHHTCMTSLTVLSPTDDALRLRLLV